jgi:hypothetical protein
MRTGRSQFARRKDPTGAGVTGHYVGLVGNIDSGIAVIAPAEAVLPNMLFANEPHFAKAVGHALVRDNVCKDSSGLLFVAIVVDIATRAIVIVERPGEIEFRDQIY